MGGKQRTLFLLSSWEGNHPVVYLYPSSLQKGLEANKTFQCM